MELLWGRGERTGVFNFRRTSFEVLSANQVEMSTRHQISVCKDHGVKEV